jgi:arylsulfatase A-like enzyme
MGWGQPSCYDGKLAPTPNIDSIAKKGVRFTDGYVSACVCSPSRVGLMTGRYQARTGHDANTEGKLVAGRELSSSEKTIAEHLKRHGYTTGIIGKWHLGVTAPEFMPARRGFDFSMGTIGNIGEVELGYYRNEKTFAELPGAPVTSPIYAAEACTFIDGHRDRPWFLYMPFNAVHSPNAASPEYLASVAQSSQHFGSLSENDHKYAAMLIELDDCIGRVLNQLRESNLEEQTLIFLLSDNSGAVSMAEQNGLRGKKWFLWEGGIRVAWMVQWKGRIPAGQVVDTPVIQLDVLPTALAAARATPYRFF